MSRPEQFSTEDLLERFTYHPPHGSDSIVHEGIRSRARELAGYLVGGVAPGRELALALTKLEECVMWGNAGRARAGGPST